MQSADMEAFLRLEYLRLVNIHSADESINSVQFTLPRLQSLRHLHIEGWSPSMLIVPPACQVHAVWKHRAQEGKSREWFLSPCWRAPGIGLASLDAGLGTQIEHPTQQPNM